MSDVVLVHSIRHVAGGYIVEARSPYHNKASGYGEVICSTLDDVFDLLVKCDIDEERRVPSATAPQVTKEIWTGRE